MNYAKQIVKVIAYIGKNLDQSLSLEQLSEVACFSKYHFHRLFTIHTGLSLQQYIRWLRLKRAAHQLIVEQERAVVTIAIDAGFESHEAFARAFKQVTGLTPKEFRLNASWHDLEKPPYRLLEQGDNMQVTIRKISARRLAVLEHRGSPKLLAGSVNKLINWAKAQPFNLKPGAGDAFGFAYSDIDTTPEDKFRFDLAITIPEQLTIDDASEVYARTLPAGRYATLMHKGSRDNMAEAIYYLYREWLPSSNEELGELPCILCYHNFEHEVAETELLTECWLQLK